MKVWQPSRGRMTAMKTALARVVLGLATDGERMRALLRRTPDAERSGRTELMVFGTTYGAWLGVAAPLALESESPEAYGVGLLLGAPLGFFAAKQYADRKNPTEGQTRAVTFGGTWGSYMGIALVELLDVGGSGAANC